MSRRTIHFKNGKTITVIGDVVLYSPTMDKVRKTDNNAHYVNQEEVLFLTNDDSNA
ncbi:hypothetical protein [Kurthia sibirica]|uniref:hypothetical protein n=1 Tax=Kurthia sibirica TaxID=202750 RepID=UPI0011750296|nr:hypothetical protein [Kurthia sibirica]GEK34836.1 hypothetical protein KSI01_23690 [Kurthia sibirica]